MALITVARPLRDKLGEDATDCLVHLFEQTQADQRSHLFELLEERFYRRVAETEQRFTEQLAATEQRFTEQLAATEQRFTERLAATEQRFTERLAATESALHQEMHAGFVEVHRQIGDIHKHIADVHKQLAVQTRWFLVAVGAVAVLIPVVQRVVEALFP